MLEPEKTHLGLCVHVRSLWSFSIFSPNFKISQKYLRKNSSRARVWNLTENRTEDELNFYPIIRSNHFDTSLDTPSSGFFLKVLRNFWKHFELEKTKKLVFGNWTNLRFTNTGSLCKIIPHCPLNTRHWNIIRLKTPFIIYIYHHTLNE